MLLLLKQVKIVVQYPTTNVSLFFNDRCKEAIYKREEKDDNGVIRPNDLIYLHGDDCVKKSLYQIVTYDEESNAFVLRIIDALPSVVYPLNETLCKRMGIEYEKNLVMLPANIEWKKHREEIDCSAEITNDLGTYPSYKGYIKHVFLKLSGCESIDSTYIKMPNGHEYSKYDISRQLKVRSLAQLGMFNSRNVGGLLSHSIVTSIFGNFEGYSGSLSRENHNTICDRNGDIYIYLDLSSLNLTKQDVDGKNIEELFQIEYPDYVEPRRVQQAPQPSTETRSVPTPQTQSSSKPTSISSVEGLIRSYDNVFFEIFKNGRWQPMNGTVDISKLHIIPDKDAMTMITHEIINRETQRILERNKRYIISRNDYD